MHKRARHDRLGMARGMIKRKERHGRQAWVRGMRYKDEGHKRRGTRIVTIYFFGDRH